MFAGFEVLGGDFLPSKETHIYYGTFPRFKAALIGEEFLLSQKVGEEQEGVTVPFSSAVSFEEVDVEKVNSGDAATFGLLGALALGPLGLLAGGALGAFNKKKMFVIQFQDGRKLVGKTDKLSYSNLKEAFQMREHLG